MHERPIAPAPGLTRGLSEALRSPFQEVPDQARDGVERF